MKIKISNKVQELEGNVIEKVATPFGNSAHLNIGKLHTGEVMKVISENVPEYEWILSKTALAEVQKECGKILAKEEGRLKHLKVQAVNNLSKRFDLSELTKVTDILAKDKRNKSMIKTIKKTYNL